MPNYGISVIWGGATSPMDSYGFDVKIGVQRVDWQPSNIVKVFFEHVTPAEQVFYGFIERQVCAFVYVCAANTI